VSGPSPACWFLLSHLRSRSRPLPPSSLLSILSILSIPPPTNLPSPVRIEAFRAYNPAANIHRISPTPLLMTVAHNDVLTPTDLAIEAYARAREPKELHILPGGHFDAYSGGNFERNAGRQVEFLRGSICA
jgi:fermentation-respiration switch protein FrsA (DUF1100 family)